MPKRSTQTNLLDITQFLHERTKAGDAVDVLYFDFTKAFDQVDHGLLAAKLATLSLPCTLYTVVMNFITNRRYKLKADGTQYQHTIAASSAVPQGSHCGPILYLIMTIDIVQYVRDLNINESLYADDTKFFAVVNNRQQMDNMQLAIDRLSKWSIDNRIKLNASKTYHITYSKKNCSHPPTHYYMGAERINKVSTMKDLGIVFDEHLTFDQHINQLLATANRMFGMSRRFAFEIRSPKIILKLLYTYIVPVMEYCPRRTRLKPCATITPMYRA